MTQQDQSRLLRGYENMLHRLRELMDEPDALTRPQLATALQAAKNQAVEKKELTEEEADRIAKYLGRDLEDAASYPRKEDEDLSGWLYMDMRLIEDWLWDTFSSVADRSRVELALFNRQFGGRYISGEVAGPGALQCLGCKEQLEFDRVAELPACPNCGGEEFQRPGSAEG